MADKEAFSINFLRQEFIPSSARRTAAYLGIGWVIFNVIIVAGLLATALYSSIRWYHIEGKLRGQLPPQTALKVLNQEVDLLRERAAGDLSQLKVMVELKKKRFRVAEKLAAISETLPARTWITNLSSHSVERTLTIQAIYLIDSEKPSELPMKKWMEALRADPDFSQGLKRLDLGTTTRKFQGKAELCLFEFLCEWEKK